MATTYDATRDFLKRVVAQTRSGLQRSYERASEPGQKIQISPFEAGSVSQGAALLKVATSIFADARSRANERRRIKLEEANAEGEQLRRDLLTEQIAKHRRDAAAPPEATYDITTTPRGDLVDPTMTGPLEPGTQTYGGLTSNEALNAVARIRTGERADERLIDADKRLEDMTKRTGILEDANRRGEELLRLAQTREGRLRQFHDDRRKRMAVADPLKYLPMERANLEELEQGLYMGDVRPSEVDMARKNIYLAMIRDGRAAAQPEDFARAVMTDPVLMNDPQIHDELIDRAQFPEGFKRGPFLAAYQDSVRARRARAEAANPKP
jgi:hypothetical protein